MYMFFSRLKNINLLSTSSHFFFFLHFDCPTRIENKKYDDIGNKVNMRIQMGKRKVMIP